MHQQEDASLIAQSRLGDHQAFEQLALRYEGQVYNLAYRLTGDRVVAQDILQDTFTNAYRQLASFKSGNFRAWLLRIAANASKDHLRSAHRRRQVSLDALVDAGSFQTHAPGESPEDYSLRQELNRVLQAAILTLPHDQRLALVLVDVQGLDYQSAADVLRIPPGTVKSRLSRARAAMRDRLAPHTELFPTHLRLNQ